MKKIIPLLCSMMLLTACSVSSSNEPQVVPNNPENQEAVSAPKVEAPSEAEQSVEPSISSLPEVEADLDKDVEIQRTKGYISVEPLTLNLRDTEATITDSGRVHQKMDIIYLDYDYPALKELGYIYLDIVITLDAREVNDGYQYLFVYNTSKCQSAAESLVENFVPSAGDGLKEGLLIKEQFELGPGKKQTSWETREFHYVLSTDYIIDDLYLRYGANGVLADTWINKNVQVTVQPKLTKN